MIESWWRSSKHGWLFVNHLDSMATLRKLVGFYVVEHNTVMPHSAFDGQTPDEMYFGRGEVVPDELAKKRREARTRRVEENRKMACSNCPRGSAIASEDKAAKRVARIEGGIATDAIAPSDLRNVQRRSCEMSSDAAVLTTTIGRLHEALPRVSGHYDFTGQP